MLGGVKKKMEYLSAQTDTVLLFHSGTGKDSIMLLDLCSRYMKRVVCLFMYTVPNLKHINKYINWAINRYGVEFYQVPHFAASTAISMGALGCVRNESVKKTTLADITVKAKEKLGIDWAVFGFKMNDSMNRRLMLNGYEQKSFNEITKNAYPLSELSNIQVNTYIKDNGLIEPISYGRGQSTGASPYDRDFMEWCRVNYPQDYKKILSYFPLAQYVE